jgi:lambda family phage minor tail protein L
MSLETEVLTDQQLPAYIELFEIDAQTINGNIYRLTPMVNANYTNLTWGGQVYTPWPITITGIAETSSGAPARPQVSLSNIDHYFGALAQTLEDMVGTKVIYRRTFASYLGTNIASAPVRLKVNKLISRNKTGIVFELKSATDVDKLKLPRAQMLREGKRPFPGLGINKRTS